MTFHYTQKKASIFHYYTCAAQVKGLQQAGHRNRVAAHRAEERILAGVRNLLEAPELVEQAMEKAREKAEANLAPKKRYLAEVKRALQENQEAIDKLVSTIMSGTLEGDLLGLLQDQAGKLKRERDRLESEKRLLSADLATLSQHFDVEAFQAALSNFGALAENAEPEELNRLMRLLVARIEWMPDDQPIRVHFYHPPQKPKSPPSEEEGDGDEFATARRLDGPDHRSLKPVVLRLAYRLNQVVVDTSAILIPRAVT